MTSIATEAALHCLEGPADDCPRCLGQRSWQVDAGARALLTVGQELLHRSARPCPRPVLDADNITAGPSDGRGVVIQLPAPLTCARPSCGHTWTPRGGVVRICPACKSPHWRTPARARQGQGVTP